MAAAASVYPPLDQRPVKNTVLLFDVDDTLTKPRQVLGSIKALAIPS
jgi:phosphomannomutase